jgi:hypothetical protein
MWYVCCNEKYISDHRVAADHVPQDQTQPGMFPQGLAMLQSSICRARQALNSLVWPSKGLVPITTPPYAINGILIDRFLHWNCRPLCDGRTTAVSGGSGLSQLTLWSS